MIAGALPPSSKRQGLRFRPHAAPMIRPTAVEPVKLTFLTNGLSMSAFVTTAALEVAWAMTFKTPGGRPASARTEAIAQEHLGENSGALRMTVFPAARAYATDRTPRTYLFPFLAHTLAKFIQSVVIADQEILLNKKLTERSYFMSQL